MQLKIDAKLAERLLRDAASQVNLAPLDAGWEARFEHLSQLCESGASKTHIAFIGTETLAKAVDVRVDLRAIKPKLAPGNATAYSARSLCHGVLVPLSAELGFSLGVSGREPLNNQPYFRMSHLGDETPVHTGGRAAFDYMISLVVQLDRTHAAEAFQALRAFVAVRRRYQRNYALAGTATAISPARLLAAITRLVTAKSEGGRRAQAVVAGLLDVVAGSGRVQSGRINDPSRHHPGDVAVRSVEVAEAGAETYEKCFEVRDKPGRFSDVVVFGRTCLDRGVREAAMVLVSEDQKLINASEVLRWAEGLGVSMTLFAGWEVFVDQCLFWAPAAKPLSASLAVETIRERLVEVEASPSAVTEWDTATTEIE